MKPGDVLPEEACRTVLADGPRTGTDAANRLVTLLGVDHDEALHILWDQVDAGVVTYWQNRFQLGPALTERSMP